jgi:hypothetical protein
MQRTKHFYVKGETEACNWVLQDLSVIVPGHKWDHLNQKSRLSAMTATDLRGLP